MLRNKRDRNLQEPEAMETIRQLRGLGVDAAAWVRSGLGVSG